MVSGLIGSLLWIIIASFLSCGGCGTEVKQPFYEWERGSVWEALCQNRGVQLDGAEELMSEELMSAGLVPVALTVPNSGVTSLSRRQVH